MKKPTPNYKLLFSRVNKYAVVPWGDLMPCEDDGELNHLRGIRPDGKTYTFATNISSWPEMAGAVFSPSGKTLFVNIQENGDTIAITGPWEKLSHT